MGATRLVKNLLSVATLTRAAPALEAQGAPLSLKVYNADAHMKW